MSPKRAVTAADMANWTTPMISGIVVVVLPPSMTTIQTVGPAVIASTPRRNTNRGVRWEALCHVVGTSVNSDMVAPIMISVATAPPNAETDQIIAGVAA